jgi:hypothetical protein
MGERGDIIRMMQRELSRRKLEGERPDRVIAADLEAPLVGRLLSRGLSDELHDRHFLILDGVDGRVHYIDIGQGDAVEPLAEGATVRVTPRVATVRASDRTIAEVAASNDGVYSVDRHLRHDPRASQDFAERHVRRLEALRRAGTGVDRLPDGSWRIAGDHLDRVATHEARMVRARPVEVETLSRTAVERLPTIDAPTWLDREQVSDARIAVRDAGFGAEVRAAAARRQAWLVEQGLADLESAGRLQWRSDGLAVLERRELAAAGSVSPTIWASRSRRRAKGTASPAGSLAASISRAAAMLWSRTPASSRWCPGGRCSKNRSARKHPGSSAAPT